MIGCPPERVPAAHGSDPLIPYLPPPEPLPLLGVRLPVFGLLLFASVLVAYAAILARGRAVGLGAPGEVARFARVLFLAAALGAHTGGILLDHGLASLSRPSLFLTAEGSFSSAAGLGAAALAGALYAGVWRLDPRPWADVAAWAFPFGLAVARIGCALAHDHPGRLSSSWLAVRFPGGARLDCGLLELMAAPLLVALAVALGRRRLAPGRLAGAVGVAYILFRFPLDFLRASDVPRADARLLGLTFAQWACLPLLAACVLLLLVPRPRPDPPRRSRPGGVVVSRGAVPR